MHKWLKIDLKKHPTEWVWKLRQKMTVAVCQQDSQSQSKPLCTGRSWSLWGSCRSTWTLMSAVYKNSSNNWIMCHIYASCFKSDFVSIKCHWKKPEEEAVFLLDHCPVHPSANILKLKDRKFCPRIWSHWFSPCMKVLFKAAKLPL
jgi:hypothetical protein